MTPKPTITPTLISLKNDFFLNSSLLWILEICISIKGIWVLKKVSLKAMLVWVKGPGLMIINFVESLFAANEVDEIWITFPDHQIKYKRTKHRMTNDAFLKRYKNILNDAGIMHLKTDSEFMHGYTLGLLHGQGHEVQYANHDVYRQEGSPEEVTAIQTFYENQYLATQKAITYIRFKIN